MKAKQVIKEIKKYSKFLVTSHVGVEGDALGSELALASLLRKLGKKVYIVDDSKIPSNYQFLPGIKSVRHRLRGLDFQALVVLDCADKKRIGRVTNLLKKGQPIINIDHHPGNSNFGRINWIDLNASSCGEMVYSLFKAAKIRLDKNEALQIYTAILTDTGSFRHCNTTSTTLNICSRLLKFGINPDKAYSRIYESITVRELVYVRKILSRVSFAADNKIAWVKIKRSEYQLLNSKHEALGKVLDFLKSVDKVKIVLVFCQTDRGRIKLSMRSKAPLNVQKVAMAFGGGGHKLASGCIIKGTLKEVERKVLRQVKRMLLRQHTKYPPTLKLRRAGGIRNTR